MEIRHRMMTHTAATTPHPTPRPPPPLPSEEAAQRRTVAAGGHLLPKSKPPTPRNTSNRAPWRSRHSACGRRARCRRPPGSSRARNGCSPPGANCCVLRASSPWPLRQSTPPPSRSAVAATPPPPSPHAKGATALSSTLIPWVRGPTRPAVAPGLDAPSGSIAGPLLLPGVVKPSRRSPPRLPASSCRLLRRLAAFRVSALGVRPLIPAPGVWLAVVRGQRCAPATGLWVAAPLLAAALPSGVGAPCSLTTPLLRWPVSTPRRGSCWAGEVSPS
jgi:hypothetical protein